MSHVVMWTSKWVQVGVKETLNDHKQKIEVPIYIAKGEINKNWYGYKQYKKESK